MHKLIRDLISIAINDKMITLNNAACYEWEIIPNEKALQLTYN